MKRRWLTLLLFVSSFAFGQGTLVAPQVALKTVNGLTVPIANATITVCVANTGGLPCSPALVGAIFKDAALTQPLSNPFASDAFGNYNFAIGAGNYTVTVTAAGFIGNSYQITVPAATTGGSGTVNTVPVWVGTTLLGNSMYAQNSGGTAGTVNGSLTVAGKVTAAASSGSAASLNAPHGTPPTTPVNGDLWTTTSGLFAQINGVTVGPFGTGSGAGASTGLDNCAPDQTGNSFFQVASLSNYLYAHWEFVFGQASAIYCTLYIPSAATGATFVLDIAANDGTAGHTANFQTCDGLVNSGSINIGALTCAGNQTYTTTSTAYTRVTLTYNVQSTLTNGCILVVKIATSTTGTAPTANLTVYPHFIL